ncbi:MAG: 3-oxoacyl-(acyl carrier protein) synthase III [Chloroflexi bacterium OLB14]|nr:MAG: 3-oxoacyl-(acyl carrier protein) synthase III [Chloroflexi bacterium OLB14]
MSENLRKLSFYERPNVENEIIPIGEGVPMGLEGMYSKELGIGGVYGSWGKSYSNENLVPFVEHRVGEALQPDDILNLSDLGFDFRQHIQDLNDEEHLQLELEVGSRLLRRAIEVCGWQANEVDGVLIGMSGPVSHDYVSRIAQMAGVRESALKVSVHKACDGSMGGLHLALNPRLAKKGDFNIAEELRGKKVLVGGIEGLSRFTSGVKDKNALQLFGNGMGVLGVVPDENMKFLVGKSFENYDEDGLLAVRMYYPHSRPDDTSPESLVDVIQEDASHIRISGLMHEPEDGASIEMAGLMGMVKLFVRTGVQVVEDVYKDYHALMDKLGESGKTIATGVVHHANYKINALKGKHLSKLGINFPMPWVVNDFGNVSAASNVISFLRQLPNIKLGDHIMFDGFGAGTYYDVMAVQMGNG